MARITMGRGALERAAAQYGVSLTVEGDGWEQVPADVVAVPLPQDPRAVSPRGETLLGLLFLSLLAAGGP